MINSMKEPQSARECLTFIRSLDANVRKIGFEKLVKLISYKVDLLRETYAVQNRDMEHWKNGIQGYSNDPSALIRFASGIHKNDLFAALLKSPATAALELGKPQVRIVDKDGEQIPVLFPGDRLVFTNPYKKTWKDQVWPRWNIDTAKKDHAPGKTVTKHKSTFEKGINQNDLLEDVLKNPVGVLRNESTLMLYGCSSSYVGTASIKRGGQKTKFFLFQCDRKERPKKRDGRISGYRTQCHGYPVSKREVRDKFKRAPELAKILSL